MALLIRREEPLVAGILREKPGTGAMLHIVVDLLIQEWLDLYLAKWIDSWLSLLISNR